MDGLRSGTQTRLPATRAAGAGRRAPGGWPGSLGAVLVWVLSACGGAPGQAALDEDAQAAVSAVDDSGREVVLERPAVRVLSLVPSLTETVVALGAADRLVGRTDFDADPALAELPSVGGGLDPSLEAVLSLRPDLVLSWTEGKTPELRHRLERMGIPVFAVDIRDTADVFRNLERIGILLAEDAAADSVARSVRAELAAVAREGRGGRDTSALYLVWADPPMTAGPGTFITQLMSVAGVRTIFGDLEQDWPQVSMEEVIRRQPDVVIVPVGEHRARAVSDLMQRAGWQEVRAVREGRIATVDADLMNRPGPSIGDAARALREAVLAVIEAEE